MGELFLAPATKRNDAYEIFQKTVLNRIDRGFYSQYSDSNWGKSASLWGLISSFETTWRGIKNGDWLLFYTDSNQYGYAAKVSDKEYNPRLGDAIRDSILEVDYSQEFGTTDCVHETSG